MAQLEIVEGCADLVRSEYAANTLRELEERVEALEMIVEELRQIWLRLYENVSLTAHKYLSCACILRGFCDVNADLI